MKNIWVQKISEEHEGGRHTRVEGVPAPQTPNISHILCRQKLKRAFIFFFVFQLLNDVSSLHIDISKPCESCENVGENWVCLTCSMVKCSRYINSHMVEHNAESKHPLVLSFSDLSVWCYDCDSCKLLIHGEYTSY